MKIDTETVHILKTEWQGYQIVIGSKKNCSYDLIDKLANGFEIIKVIPPKTVIEVKHVQKDEDKKVVTNSNDKKLPYRNPNPAIAIQMWETVKQSLNDKFTVTEFQTSCIKNGFEKEIRANGLYNRLQSLMSHNIIEKVRDSEGIPITPLTYSIIVKESPADYLKKKMEKELNNLRDTAKMG